MSERLALTLVVALMVLLMASVSAWASVWVMVDVQEARNKELAFQLETPTKAEKVAGSVFAGYRSDEAILGTRAYLSSQVGVGPFVGLYGQYGWTEDALSLGAEGGMRLAFDPIALEVRGMYNMSQGAFRVMYLLGVGF